MTARRPVGNRQPELFRQRHARVAWRFARPCHNYANFASPALRVPPDGCGLTAVFHRCYTRLGGGKNANNQETDQHHGR